MGDLQAIRRREREKGDGREGDWCSCHGIPGYPYNVFLFLSTVIDVEGLIDLVCKSV